ncbi:MAG: outer membrane protein assembly factor BamE [Thiobacillaceae bacterium]
MSLLSACSSVDLGGIGPHRIDVQQGNALDQENVAKLKPGLNRAQVRFLLGTPLVVDPFRTDRWDYVYTFYKAGKLAEQKRITLFFDGETLKRIEGDVPPEVRAAKADGAEPAVTVTTPAEPLASTPTSSGAVAPVVAQSAVDKPVPQAVAAVAVVETAGAKTNTLAEPSPKAAVPGSAVKLDKPSKKNNSSTVKMSSPGRASSIVPPLPSPPTSSSQPGAPVYADPRPASQSGMQIEGDVNRIQPDVMPVFPETSSAKPVSDESEAAVLLALKSWAEAWSKHDDETYIAAYAPNFVPAGGGTRADWEKRRRLLFGLAKNIELRIESPTVELASDGSALVTLNQYYRSDNYRDAVVKQITLVQQAGRWLISEERVASILRPKKP